MCIRDSFDTQSTDGSFQSTLVVSVALHLFHFCDQKCQNSLPCMLSNHLIFQAVTWECKYFKSKMLNMSHANSWNNLEFYGDHRFNLRPCSLGWRSGSGTIKGHKACIDGERLFPNLASESPKQVRIYNSKIFWVSMPQNPLGDCGLYIHCATPMDSTGTCHFVVSHQ